MLKITNLNSGYGKMQILWGINLEVKTNQIVSIIGPNGSGKSTVLKSIYGISSLFSGKILFKNRDISNIDTSKIINLGISYAPQGKLVFNDMTVQENMEMGGSNFLNKQDLKKRIEELFSEFPIFLRKKRNKIANSLSGGEKQIISLARALVTKPMLLLLDEPTLGLSPLFSKYILSMLLKIKKERNLSVLIVEQNAKSAVEIADRTYVLENGKIAMEGGKEILKNPEIKNIYFGGK